MNVGDWVVRKPQWVNSDWNRFCYNHRLKIIAKRDYSIGFGDGAFWDPKRFDVCEKPIFEELKRRLMSCTK